MNLGIDSATVRNIIVVAQQREHAHNRYMEKYFPDRMINLGQDMHKDSAEHKEHEALDNELCRLLTALDYEQILSLEALMFVGRGDDSDFTACRADLAETHPDPKGKSLAVSYIAEKAPLAEYLSKGLQILGL